MRSSPEVPLRQEVCGWLVIPRSPIRINGAIVKETNHPEGATTQLDIRVCLEDEKVIIESFGGLGETVEEAIHSAYANFVQSSLHVILAAFFLPDDEQVFREEWKVGDLTKTVTIGNIVIKGDPPVKEESQLDWFEELEKEIKATELGRGTHWIRLYYAQMDKQMMVCEVLLDNELWETVQRKMEKLNWAAKDEFYSMRIFLILQDKL